MALRGVGRTYRGLTVTHDAEEEGNPVMPSRRQRLIEDLTARYRELLERRLSQRRQTLDEIEQTVEEISQELERELEQRILDLQHPPQCPRHNQERCSCGRLARYRRMGPRALVTRHGTVRFTRPYYYCEPCHRGFGPADLSLGIDGGSTSTQVRVWAARQSTREAFEPAAETLAELTGVRLNASTVEEIAVATGKAFAAAQNAQAQRHQEGQLPIPPVRPQRLYISMDGVYVPLREPWKRDGSAGAVQCRWGECKTAAVYEIEPGAGGEGRPVRQGYVATLEDRSVFGPLVATLAHQHGHHLAREVIVLGDGAAWLWLVAASQFPNATQILDYYHMKEHLFLVANARFGAETAAAREWVAAREAELAEDRVGAVLAAIGEWQPRRAEKREVRDGQYRYFMRNAERMRYGTFRRLGYHIGSGVVESACGHVVGQRLDQAGMHWREESAEAIVRLRAGLRSTDPIDLRTYCRTAA
jgi:hypothetical protein